jgi:hypothetical protein
LIKQRRFLATTLIWHLCAGGEEGCRLTSAGEEVQIACDVVGHLGGTLEVRMAQDQESVGKKGLSPVAAVGAYR